MQKMIRQEIVEREKSEKLEDGVVNETNYNENRSSRRDDYERQKSRKRYNSGKFSSGCRARNGSKNSSYKEARVEMDITEARVVKDGMKLETQDPDQDQVSGME